MSHLFETVENADLLRFAAENPLAWIVPAADPSAAILMPVLIETEASGVPVSLLGHLPRRGAITGLLGENTRATCLFLGPNAYIPPDWISKPGWAPTWNFVSLKVTGDIRLDPALTDEAVRRAVDHMERPMGAGQVSGQVSGRDSGRDSGGGSDWTVEQMGERYGRLLHRIIGFQMEDIGLTPRFKTGQDETEQSYREVFEALAGHPLQSWMR